MKASLRPRLLAIFSLRRSSILIILSRIIFGSVNRSCNRRGNLPGNMPTSNNRKNLCDIQALPSYLLLSQVLGINSVVLFITLL